ncbi:hypothetical protein VTN31DRAFT_6092 [Thermomyces dupontii]|uniref:uncharacterized protein n=1 Tax=Talaromyces thermophilus TaxID=28565 RepID=UPI003742C262
MAIPNEALQKVIQEIETRAIAAQQQINLVKSQIGAKQRDLRLLQLTANELRGLPQDTNIYEGVGKMFVATPIPTVDKRLSTESEKLKGDIGNLEKRLHYLETTQKNSREHIEQMLRGGGSRS